MSTARFVSTETTRLDLTDGDWLEVKRGLSFAEEQAVAGAFTGRLQNLDKAPEIGLDLVAGAVERIAVWVVSWSFTDDGNPPKPVAVSRDAIKSLTPAAAQEISDALDVHVAAVDAAGKAPNGKPARGGRST